MAEAAPATSTGRRVFILLTIVLIVVAVWSGGWAWLSREVGIRMDNQIAKLAARGLIVTCPQRTIGGWPFRIDVDCSNPTFRQADRATSIAVTHLRVTTLVYQPTLIIAELDGPLAVTGPNGETVNASWTQLHASVGLSFPPAIKPDRIAIEADGLTVSGAKPGGQEAKLVAGHAELHGRPATDASAGGTDIEVAGGLKAATASLADHVLGPEATDYSFDVVARGLPIGATDGQPFAKVWANDGGRVDINSARMGLGDFAVEGKGALTAGSDGLVNGQIKLIASGLGALMSPAGGTMKGRGALIGLATAFTIFGKSVTDNGVNGRSLDLAIDQGRVKVGPSPFGHVPPLF